MRGDKVPPWLVVHAGIFMAVVISMTIIRQQFPEHWFVRHLLAGERMWVAVLVLVMVMGWFSALTGAAEKRDYQRRSKRSDFK